MHKMPLKLPATTWKRNLPEEEIFNSTLNTSNVKETDKFITLLDEAAVSYRNDCLELADVMYKEAKKCLTARVDSSTHTKGMHLVDSIILKIPRDSSRLVWALKTRGDFNYQSGSFEFASRDYEIFFEACAKGNSEVGVCCQVYGRLTICMYMTKQQIKSRKYLIEYQKCRSKLSFEILQGQVFAELDEHIKTFEPLVNNMECIVAPAISESLYFLTPYNGFNGSSEIPLTSAACGYRNDSVYAKSTIPQGAVLFVEEHFYQPVKFPFLRCENCRHYTTLFYTCLECRYKCYCSLLCMEIDKPFHQYECEGYMQLSLIFLDAANIFRLFLRILFLLNDHVFHRKIFHKLKTGGQVLNAIYHMLGSTMLFGTRYLGLIRNKPSYGSLSSIQYSTVITTAFRLTIFIEKKTNIMETFLNKLSISNKQKMIVVGALLMRLHSNILLNSFDIEYVGYLTNFSLLNGPQPDVPKYINPIRGIVEDIYEFYNIDVEKDINERNDDIIKCETPVCRAASAILNWNHIKNCTPIDDILSIFKDNIIMMYFNPELSSKQLEEKRAQDPEIINGHLAQLGSDKSRFEFVKGCADLFHKHFTDYFLPMFEFHPHLSEVITLYCPTLRRFKHSCVPNVQVMVLNSGVVIGKSLREINENEELNIAFKAHYLMHTRPERKNFLKIFNTKCNCKSCQLVEIGESTNIRLAIKCDKCKDLVITPAHKSCSECQTLYADLLAKYCSTIRLLEKQLEAATESNAGENKERDVYVLQTILLRQAKRCFTQQNEISVNIELQYAHFLALKNFAQQSYDLLMEVKEKILKYYPERIIWFTFYAFILETIKVLLHYNLEKLNYCTLSKDALLNLCRLGIYIIKGQKETFEFYEKFDTHGIILLEDLKRFFIWKKRIICEGTFFEF
ncbi:uncharacterized protein ACN2A1_008055 isoform 1-T1 [Glossina fuscipes fuscipes]